MFKAIRLDKALKIVNVIPGLFNMFCLANNLILKAIRLEKKTEEICLYENEFIKAIRLFKVQR